MEPTERSIIEIVEPTSGKGAGEHRTAHGAAVVIEGHLEECGPHRRARPRLPAHAAEIDRTDPAEREGRNTRGCERQGEPPAFGEEEDQTEEKERAADQIAERADESARI